MIALNMFMKKRQNLIIKKKIDYFNPIDTKCPDHPAVPINLFCLDEKGKTININI